MEDLGTVAVGCVVGLVVIGVVNAFPGEPFDYDKGETPSDSLSPCGSVGSKSEATMTLSKEEVREVDIAARQLKVQKLQQLLGLEKHEVQKMIDEAKTDAINGRRPRAPTNYMRWLDIAFYTLIFSLMVVVLRTEYSVDVVRLVASMFPREAETVQKVAVIMPTFLLSLWK